MAGVVCDVYINNSHVAQTNTSQTCEITETGLKLGGSVVWTHSGTRVFKGFAASQGVSSPATGLEVGQTLTVGDVSALTGQSYDIIHIYSVESAPNRTISLENLYEFKYKLDEVKQDKLVSGTNIKTVNSQSILGSGNISTPNTNYYHVAGSWSGLSYILTGKGGASNIVITLPTGTSSTTVAAGNHNHNSLYLGINAKATDSDKLDGYDSSHFQTALSTQTAYSAKGSATKVPQITTNSLGQVTNITEVAISNTWRSVQIDGDEKLGSGISTGALNFQSSSTIQPLFSTTTNSFSFQSTIWRYTSSTYEAETEARINIGRYLVIYDDYRNEAAPTARPASFTGMSDPDAYFYCTGITIHDGNDGAADITLSYPDHSGVIVVTSDLETKQDTLVSGANIKTINDQSLLGTGNINTKIEIVDLTVLS